MIELKERFSPAANVLRNAIKPNAHNRWIRYKDRQGAFVIPYVISGKFSGCLGVDPLMKTPRLRRSLHHPQGDAVDSEELVHPLPQAGPGAERHLKAPH